LGEAELDGDRVDLGRVGRLADIARRKIVGRGAADPWNQEEDREGHDADHKQHQHRADEATNDVSNHCIGSGGRRA
jgi:hypothetical protein